MNYFELFDIPFSFVFDNTVIRNRYDELIDKNRPAVPGNNAATNNEKMALIEEAYVIFQDQEETIGYLLGLKKLVPDNSYEYSSQFKMEVRDIDEELMELELDENQEQLMEVEQKVNSLLIKIYEDIDPVIESYKEDAGAEEALLQVKDFYFQKIYLQRILDRINVIRNIVSL